MASINCQPNCGRAVQASPLDQIFAIFALFGTVLGVVGKLSSIKDAPFWMQLIGIAGLVLLTGLAILTMIWITAYDQCTEEPLIATENGPVRVRGLNRCVAGVAWKIRSDFTGASMAWLAPWTATHDNVDLIVSSNFWDVLELNSADVFCTHDVAGRDSEYVRCYFYTERVCKAATGSAVGATVGFFILLPLFIMFVPSVLSAAITCAGMAASFNASPTVSVTVPLAIFCGAFVAASVVIALVFLGGILAAATVGGWIGAALSSATPPTPAQRTHDTLAEKQVQVGTLLQVNGNLIIREEPEDPDDLFNSLKVNTFWWVQSAALLGQASTSIPSNPFSFVELNDLFFVKEPDETGQLRTVAHHGCDNFTSVLPTRCAARENGN